jgi:uracil-DNA glycosylase
MSSASAALSRSGVHAQWQGILSEALEAVDPDYLSLLLQSDNWLPGIDNLFRAFRRDRQAVRYILIGESPYPRAESANGIAFYDAAVDQLWSESGLSKTVNRATSLRNIIKTALLAEGYIKPDAQGKISQASIAEIDKSNLIGTLAELFQAFENNGFLLINATPVLRPDIKPALEAQYWRGFLARLLYRLAPPTDHQLTLVLWGKIAKTVETLNLPDHYRKLVSEHPYNLSFIENPLMRSLFQELKLLSLNR